MYNKQKKISIVTTLYKSEPYINEFYARAKATVQQLTDDYEIIFVNDGSPDNVLELALSIHANDPHVIIIDLSRNFGHHKAMMAGLEQAKGDLVFLLDSDLEEEPEWLLVFMQALEDKVDVVYGIQEKRKGSWLERVSGPLYYRMYRLFTGINISENIVTARLMSRRYVNALISFGEQELCISGIWYITGFYQKSVIVQKKSISETTYSLSHKISALVNTITSFSNMPLIFIFYLGIFISITGFMFAIYLVISRFFVKNNLSGWTSIITSLWILSGVQMSCLGVLGIYMSKIFSEVKKRPRFIIKNIYSKA